jgi:hypothetical protein
MGIALTFIVTEVKLVTVEQPAIGTSRGHAFQITAEVS